MDSRQRVLIHRLDRALVAAMRAQELVARELKHATTELHEQRAALAALNHGGSTRELEEEIFQHQQLEKSNQELKKIIQDHQRRFDALKYEKAQLLKRAEHAEKRLAEIEKVFKET